MTKLISKIRSRGHELIWQWFICDINRIFTLINLAQTPQTQCFAVVCRGRNLWSVILYVNFLETIFGSYCQQHLEIEITNFYMIILKLEKDRLGQKALLTRKN